ncbi:MAG: nucleotide pyrophosphohydrolase [Planctomycetota bacterium]
MSQCNGPAVPEQERVPDDDLATITDLKNVVQLFVDERNWSVFHSPKNLAMSLSIESAELMEHFQWLTPEQADQIMQDADKAHAVGEELADCLAYLLAMASRLNVDLATSLRAKMLRNAVKYPVPNDPHSVAPPIPLPVNDSPSHDENSSRDG